MIGAIGASIYITILSSIRRLEHEWSALDARKLYELVPHLASGPSKRWKKKRQRHPKQTIIEGNELRESLDEAERSPLGIETLAGAGRALSAVSHNELIQKFSWPLFSSDDDWGKIPMVSVKESSILRTNICICGRYRKLSRNMPQSPWGKVCCCCSYALLDCTGLKPLMLFLNRESLVSKLG